MQPNKHALVAAFESVTASTVGHLTQVGYLHRIRPQLQSIQMTGCVRTACIHLPDAALLRDALIQAQAGDVLVVSCFGDMRYACWGELRNLAAQIKQLAGVIIAGNVTDICALRTHQFPVFAYGVSALTTRPLDTPSRGQLDVPIDIDGVTIHPGDLAIGDDDGVFILSPPHATEVAAQCQLKEAADREKRDQLLSRLHEASTLT